MRFASLIAFGFYGENGVNGRFGVFGGNIKSNSSEISFFCSEIKKFSSTLFQNSSEQKKFSSELFARFSGGINPHLPMPRKNR